MREGGREWRRGDEIWNSMRSRKIKRKKENSGGREEREHTRRLRTDPPKRSSITLPASFNTATLSFSIGISTPPLDELEDVSE